MNFDYFYGRDGEAFQFLKVPLIFFESELFKDLSIESKVLYSFLLSRVGLSFKNNWLDQQKRVFVIFTIEEVKQKMRCGHEKAIKLFNELDTEKGIGLIERKRRGQGKPSIVYVKDFMSAFKGGLEIRNTKVKTSENQKSRSMKNRSLDIGNPEGNYIDKSKNEINKIDLSKGQKLFGIFQNVNLSKKDIEELNAHLPRQLDNYIERLSTYMKSTGVTYENHKATILSWFFKDQRINARPTRTDRKSIETFKEGEYF